ncbi:trichohyalin-like [Macrobrachium nipponense]|uniref:trichohyalin-like n=1 Tax=Macrobrachium nipponense TaxID=159736 RepID=UPI0030C888A9
MDDLFHFCCCRGVSSGFRVPGALVDAAVDSLEPEIVVDQSNSSLTAPSFAFAKPPVGLALLAALALAVCWMYRMSGRRSDELEECMECERMDEYDSEDDDETDMSESEDDDEMNLSASEEDYEMNMSESEDDDETSMNESEEHLENYMSESENELETDVSRVSRLEDSLELEDLEDGNEELEETAETEQLESTEEEGDLPRLHQEQPDVEMQRLQESLEKSQANGTRMEQLLKEAGKAIERIQRELEGKDILLEKRADDIAAMSRQIESVCLQKEQVLTEKRRLQHDLELALDRGEKADNFNKELMEQIASLERRLEETEHLLKKRDEDEMEMKRLFQKEMVDKERELQCTKEKNTELSLKLEKIETFNQILDAENEDLMRLIVDYREALDQKERKVDHLQESLARQATESESDQEKLRTLEVQMTAIEGTVEELENQLLDVRGNQEALRGKLKLTESENSTLRKVAVDLKDRNCELEKNLADETHTNLALEDKVQFLESVLCKKESQLVSASEILNAERAKTEIMAQELEVMRNWVSELGGENEKCKEKLAAKAAEVTSLQKELQNEKKLTKVLAGEAQVMKNWVAELGGENTTLQDEVSKTRQKINSLLQSLRKEKQRSRNLQDALHHGKEMENLLKEEKTRGNEMATSLRTLKVELNNRDLQIENLLNMEKKLICEKEELVEELGVTLSHGKELDSLLEEAGQKATKLANDFEEEVQKREDQLRDLLAKEEKLRAEKLELEDRLENAANLLIKEQREKVNWQQMLQEREKEVETLRKDEKDHQEQRKEMENKLQEGEKELQQLRTECENLKENWRKQEKKMIKEQQRLMERQRRQEEALREQDKYMLMTLLHGTAQRNFHLQHIALQHGTETLGSINEKEKQDEDLWLRKEKQHRKYCDAQQERTNYPKQWDVLTQTLTELTRGDSDENCEISNGKPDDKTCHLSSER